MTLKGNYSDLTSYSIGDVVGYQGEFYCRIREAGSGINPIDSYRWEKVPQWFAACAGLVMDGVGMAESGALTGKIVDALTSTDSDKCLSANQGNVLDGKIKGVNPDAKTIRLASSTASSTKLFDITVIDDGTISATEYTPPAAT